MPIFTRFDRNSIACLAYSCPGYYVNALDHRHRDCHDADAYAVRLHGDFERIERAPYSSRVDLISSEFPHDSGSLVMGSANTSSCSVSA